MLSFWLICFTKKKTLYEYTMRMLNGHYCSLTFQIYYFIFLYKTDYKLLYKKIQMYIMLILYGTFFILGLHLPISSIHFK